LPSHGDGGKLAGGGSKVRTCKFEDDLKVQVFKTPLVFPKLGEKFIEFIG
jgi:hypothetical protein